MIKTIYLYGNKGSALNIIVIVWQEYLKPVNCEQTNALTQLI